MCFFEQLFHRNQSLGAPGYHPDEKTEGPLDVLNIASGLWLRKHSILRISIINIEGKTQTRVTIVTP